MSNETNAIRPLGSGVLVKREDAKEKTRGGIVLPSTTQKDGTRIGTVVEVGRGKLLEDGRLVEPSVQRGDRVLYSQYAGTEIKVRNVGHFLIDEGDIMCVIDDGSEIG